MVTLKKSSSTHLGIRPPVTFILSPAFLSSLKRFLGLRQKPIKELIAPEDLEAFELFRQQKISFEEFLDKIKNPHTLEVINAHLISFQFKILREHIDDLKKRVLNIEKYLKISPR